MLGVKLTLITITRQWLDVHEGTLTTEWPLHHLQPRDTIVAMTIIIPIERAKYYFEDRR